MKVLHKHNVKGKHYDTLCGMHLAEDSRRRSDVLLATLEVAKEDMVLNFGEDAEVCGACLTQESAVKT
jgi:hypothetical protein